MVQVSNAAALYKKCNLSVAWKKGRKEERKKERKKGRKKGRKKTVIVA